MLTNRAPREQRGFGLIEVMVGLVIGLLSVVVIYQIYNVAEGFKRNTTAVGEAQQTGLLSTFVLGMELANAGAAIAVSAQDLAGCTDTGTILTSFRPLPVLVTDSNTVTTPDSFVVNYSLATTLVTTVSFFAAAPSGSTSYQVESPGGFHVGDLIVGISSPGGNGPCGSSKVTAVSAPDANGVVTITHTGTAVNFTPGSSLFNLGPANRAQKVQYSVVNGVLYSTPLQDANGAPLGAIPACPSAQCNPLASNVVNMKVEYGVATDTDKKGVLDTWVQAKAAATPADSWDPATLLPAPITKINQIKAVRIGLIVQGEQFDKTLGAFNWVLFDCAAVDKTTCPGRLTGSIAASTAPAGNWRYRVYETIIPLRNEIWNLTL